MVSFTTILIAVLYTGTSLLQVNGFEDYACGDQNLIVSGQNNRVCCPGKMKTTDNKTYCCYEGNDDDNHDISSCKEAFNVDDPNYAENVQSKLNITVHTPSGNNSGGSSVRLATQTLVLGVVASFAVIPAAMLAF
ncbi:hypothetical protein F5Y11DRAFT_345044 [Daldinia sp. FL1419]|nr:hypothetical protein F5Y11DRAFT_345044 [Daldinia sp. FL1419]